MWWQHPWVWLVAAAVMGAAEMLLPGFFLLGFAGGAVLVAGLIWLGLVSSLPAMVLICAVAAVAVWAGLRKIAGVRPGQSRIWDRDINEN